MSTAEAAELVREIVTNETTKGYHKNHEFGYYKMINIVNDEFL